jgi:CPA1 family monovalent cation:H+ antiporter
VSLLAGSPVARSARLVGREPERKRVEAFVAALPARVAAALALEPGFPARNEILFITFAVIFATLVLQGLSLGPLLHFLRLRGDGTEAEEAHARRVAAEAGLRRLEEAAARGDAHPQAVRYLQRMHAHKALRWAGRDREHHDAGDEERDALEAKLAEVDVGDTERESTSYRRLRRSMIDAERRAVIDLRDRGVIGDDVMRQVQRDLDLETMMLEAGEDGAPQSPYAG